MNYRMTFRLVKNKKMIKTYFLKITLFLFIFILINKISDSQDIPNRPNPPRLVNDFAKILSPEEINSLEQKLLKFNDSTSTQIVIVTVNDLGGYDKASYANAIGEKWGVGQKGKNNGIFILVKPTGKKGDRIAQIATGYGLEGVVPDAIARRIVQNEMIPQFEKNNYYAGLDKATTVLIGLVKGEFTAESYKKKTGGGIAFSFIIPILIIILFFFLSGRRKNSQTIGGSSLQWFAALMFMNSGRSSGSWGNFSSGGNSFGGFGGGSFGGGGAGGSW